MIGPLATASVRQRQRSPSRSSAASEVTILAVDAITKGWSAFSTATAGPASTGATHSPRLLRGKPQPASTRGSRCCRLSGTGVRRAKAPVGQPSARPNPNPIA